MYNIRFGNQFYLKFFGMFILCLGLVGCATTGKKINNNPDDYAMESSSQVTTSGYNDPEVQSVIDSGEINASPQEIKQLLDKNVYHFAFDSDQIKSQDYNALDAKAIYLTSHAAKNEKILIVGHTDNIGTRTYNIALGSRRATAVKAYLIAKGVNANRIKVISKGFEDPINTNNTAEARAENRRAVIHIL